MIAPKRTASDCQGAYAVLAHVAEGHLGGPEQADQPRGFAWHICKQIFRSPSQFGPIASGTVGGATCWVPTVGGGVVVRETLTHRSKLFWHVTEHTFWTILFFGIGVKLPAKLVAIEQKRIIAAALSFICTPLKAGTLRVCASVK